jgi:hypothetical protein
MSFRKGLLIFLSFLLLLLGIGSAGIYTLYQNQSKLTQFAIEKVNENFTGVLVVEKSYVSPFINFPYISIDLHHVSFYADKEMTGRPIYEIEDLYVGFDIWDIINGNYNIKTLNLSGGHLDIVQYENGEINLLVAKGVKNEESDTDNEPFRLELKEIQLHNFHITKRNLSSGQYFDMNFSDAKAKFKKDKGHIYAFLDTRFILDVMSGDSSIFEDKHLELHSTLDFEESTQLISILPSHLILEKAKFNLEGSIDLDNDLELDLKIAGNKPDFNLFAAFAPNDIAAELKKFKNEGQVYFNGIIKGKAAMGFTPFVEFHFGCDNAYFINTLADKKVEDLRFKGYYTNGDSMSLETSEFRFENFYAKPEQGIFTGSLYVRNFKDPYIAVNMNADIDFEFLAQFFGIEGLKRLKGQVLLDMNFDELVDMDKPEASLERLKKGIDSEMTIKNLSFIVPGYPHEIKNLNGHAIMEQGNLKLDSISFKIADSDFFFAGSVNDLPAIFHKHSKPIKFTFNTRSKKINFPRLLEFDSELAKATNEVLTDFRIKLEFQTSVNDLLNADPLPKGEFFIQDFYGKLKNYAHTFHDFDADILITDTDLKVKDFNGGIDDTDFHFNGLVQNYKLWFDDVKKGDTKIEFDLDSKKIKLHDLLTYEGENYLPEDYRDEVIKGLKLHGRVELHYDSIFKSSDFYLDQLTAKMNVHPLKLEKFKGRAHYEDDHLLLEDFSGVMGASDFLINMNFYTGNNKKLRRRDNYFSILSNNLDLDALFNYEQNKDISHEDSFNIFKVPFTDMLVKADIKNIQYHKIFLKDFKSTLRMQEDHFLYVDDLAMKTAGGSLSLKGYFNGSNPDKIYFNSTMTAKNIDLDQLMFKFDNFGQDYMVNENLHGQLTGTITSNVRMHPDLTPIIGETDAKMDLMIKNGSIVNFAPVVAMSSFFKDKNLNIIKFDTLQNVLSLKNGVLNIPAMNINSSLGYMEISGTQSLDLSMEYYVRVPWKMVTQVGASALFGGKKKEEVEPDQEDEIIYRDASKRTRFVNIRIVGTPDDFKISLGKNKVSS